MSTDQYVLLGLAQVRSEWFREVSRWSTSAALPIEFVKAMSTEEVRVRLRAGRGYSALLIEDSLPGLDRELVHGALDAGCAVIVVDGGRAVRRWEELGVSGVIALPFGPADLARLLAQVAAPVEPVDPAPPPAGGPLRRGFRGHLVTVIGSGGTGASTVAMALAQALGSDPRHAAMVCLADLSRHAEMAMLHGSPDVVPGVTELVDAHRSGEPTLEVVRSLTWRVEQRGYDLLLGLRRHRDWTAVRPRTFTAALDSLRRSYRVVVADADADLEGEASTGSADIEDRNAMARGAVRSADLVIVVGTADMKGVHSTLRVVRDVVDSGVPGGSVLPVVNHAPRSPRRRSEVADAFGKVLAASGTTGVPTPLNLPTRRHLDQALRSARRLPDQWTAPLASAVRALLARRRSDGEGAAPTRPSPAAVPVTPGSLGAWTETVDEEAV